MRAPFVSSNIVFHIKSFNFVWKDKSPFGLNTAFIKSLFSFRNSRIEVMGINGIVGEGLEPRSAITSGSFCLAMLENLYIISSWHFVIKSNLS